MSKQLAIPYIRLHIANYSNLHMLTNFAVKARFSCDIYAYNIKSMFTIIKHINLVLKKIQYSSNETVLENNCIMNQLDGVLHSKINFDIFIKGGDNE